MGYSLSICCKSTMARDRLVEFLRLNMRPFSVVCDERVDVRDALNKWESENRLDGVSPMYALPNGTSRHYDPTAVIHVGQGLAYGAGANKVGFNFSTQGDFGTFMYALLKWAALHSGRKRGLNALSMVGMAHLSVPYVTYDSTAEPVLTEALISDWSEDAQKEARRRWVVTPLGVQPMEEFTLYLANRFGPGYANDSDARKLMVESMMRREKALQTITEQEMQRLDTLWGEYLARETG